MQSLIGQILNRRGAEAQSPKGDLCFACPFFNLVTDEVLLLFLDAQFLPTPQGLCGETCRGLSDRFVTVTVRRGSLRDLA
jgi:hypothetical protein